jgi:hypothetical protein
MARKRNYGSEYRRRIERGLELGWSRAKARGHARPSRRRAKASQPKYGPEFQKALKALRAWDNLILAARSGGISPTRFRSFLREKRLAHFKRGKWKGSGRRWNITDRQLREITIISRAGIKTVEVKGYERADWIGEHLNAVRAFLADPDESLLRPFEGKSITDTSGRIHILETRPNTLYRLLSAGNETFEEVYRLIT